MSTKYQDINKDEPTRSPGAPKDEASRIVAQARAQAAKIVQGAEVQAKHIIAQARAEAGHEPDEGEVRPRTCVYNAQGESKVVYADDIPQGWYDHPDKAKRAGTEVPRETEEDGIDSKEIESHARLAYLEMKKGRDDLRPWSQISKTKKTEYIERMKALIENPAAAQPNDFDIAAMRELEALAA